MILETDRQTDIHVPPQPNNNINKLLQENNNISDLDGGVVGDGILYHHDHAQ